MVSKQQLCCLSQFPELLHLLLVSAVKKTSSDSLWRKTFLNLLVTQQTPKTWIAWQTTCLILRHSCLCIQEANIWGMHDRGLPGQHWDEQEEREPFRLRARREKARGRLSGVGMAEPHLERPDLAFITGVCWNLHSSAVIYTQKHSAFEKATHRLRIKHERKLRTQGVEFL